MQAKPKIRDNALNEIQKLLLGPRQGENEFVEGRITLRYLSGILFPRGEQRSNLGKESEGLLEVDGSIPEASVRGGDELWGDNDNPLSMANEELPSSVGLSFAVKVGV